MKKRFFDELIWHNLLEFFNHLFSSVLFFFIRLNSLQVWMHWSFSNPALDLCNFCDTNIHDTYLPSFSCKTQWKLPSSCQGLPLWFKIWWDISKKPHTDSSIISPASTYHHHHNQHHITTTILLIITIIIIIIIVIIIIIIIITKALACRSFSTTTKFSSSFRLIFSSRPFKESCQSGDE